MFQRMKPWTISLMALLFCITAHAQIQRVERKSLLDSDPDVVYLEQVLQKPITLQVIKEAPVFSDQGGSHRLGFLKANQTVPLEAITDKAYKVRGNGTNGGIAGWVAPWAFSSEKDPAFVAHLKELYTRQIQVNKLIAEKKIAVGMTLTEVSRSLGTPTKTEMRNDGTTQSGRWEFIDYEEIKHYTTQVNPQNGQVYRVLAYVTREEKGKTSVEFENDFVKAIEQSKNRQGGDTSIVIPRLVYVW